MMLSAEDAPPCEACLTALLCTEWSWRMQLEMLKRVASRPDSKAFTIVWADATCQARPNFLMKSRDFGGFFLCGVPFFYFRSRSCRGGSAVPRPTVVALTDTAFCSHAVV
jgi:hypothetical protein